MKKISRPLCSEILQPESRISVKLPCLPMPWGWLLCERTDTRPRGPSLPFFIPFIKFCSREFPFFLATWMRWFDHPLNNKKSINMLTINKLDSFPIFRMSLVVLWTDRQGMKSREGDDPEEWSLQHPWGSWILAHPCPYSTPICAREHTHVCTHTHTYTHSFDDTSAFDCCDQ